MFTNPKKAILALLMISMFLMLFGCSSKVQIVQEPVLVTIPKALIKDCEVVDMESATSIEDLSQKASEALMSQYEQLAKCNLRLKQAREIQSNQEKIYGKGK